jgi:superfamily I DNA/RNA helicase
MNRVFQQPFSWKSLGVDIRGRSRNLRVNYRTSHQIRQQADRLLGPEVADVDGNSEDRTDTISVFNGPPPVIRVFPDNALEAAAVGAWLTDQSKAGLLAHEFGVFVRSQGELDRAQAAVKAACLPFKILDDHVETTSGHVSISTMHLAKGLEFRAVAVMACDDETEAGQRSTWFYYSAAGRANPAPLLKLGALRAICRLAVPMMSVTHEHFRPPEKPSTRAGPRGRTP